MARPLTLTELKPGKAVGAHRGFADTFNWMRRFIENLAGGPGVTVDRTNDDHPVIRADASVLGGGATVRPWTVRYNGSAASGWEVYIPAGACPLSGVTICNPHGVEGGVARTDDWYSVFAPAGTTVTDVQMTFVLHVKGRVRIDAETSDHPCVLVSMYSGSAETANLSAGDLLTVTVATGTRTTGSSASTSVAQIYREAVAVQIPVATQLEPYWYAQSAQGIVTAAWNFKPHMRPQTAVTVGGASLSCAISDTDLDGWTTCYLVVDCSGSTPALSLSGSWDSSTSKLCVWLFTFASNCLQYDARDNLFGQTFYP